MDSGRLGRFEHKYLDKNGGTLDLQYTLKFNRYLLDNESEEVRAKYGTLVPSTDENTSLQVLEHVWAPDGNKFRLKPSADNITTCSRAAMKR